MRTPEQNEALLHREVERAQARRWEPEDEDEQENQVHCDECDTLIYFDEILWDNTERFCSTACAKKYRGEYDVKNLQ